MTSDAVTLRLAAASDAAPIARMSRDLIEHGLAWRYRPDRVRRLITRRDASTVAACASGGIVGFAAMQFDAEHAHLVLLAVQPAHRRCGVARRMAQWLLDSAQVAGVVSVYLELRAANEPALRLYRALGFEPTLAVAGYYDQRETAIRMVRLLRAPDTAAPPDDWLRRCMRR